ncbi:trehalose 6-phosphate phosphatase [Geomonas silvestris]|uniref:Trehalose 6-phosphate phosphatase n=1 Tax=Geomonas silvestris TaxID=2740184 RepID=A0A6V8MF38_9BACT|nr:trehalose-phosphatase [Geomonas silvestris]GFO58259.1 trehalose 6-phosphate phosphatase [Geomonas silvestris]
MSTTYLLEEQGLQDLTRFTTRGTLFAFDLDGTLAPIKVHASEVRLAPELFEALKRLDQLTNVCVLTGRSRKDALAILRMDLRLVLGNHGCEWPPELRPRNKRYIEKAGSWRAVLEKGFTEERGVEIEYKGETLAIHYRGAPDPDQARLRIEKLVGELIPAPRVIGGKFVMNLLPMEAETKGTALVEAMEFVGAGQAIYIGDDVTDEEVFKMALPNLLGVHIGTEPWTAATHYLKEQGEITAVVQTVVRLLGG